MFHAWALPQTRRSPRHSTAAELGYLLALAPALTASVLRGDARLLALVPAGLLLAFAFAALGPGRLYLRTAVKPFVLLRWWGFQRLAYATALFTGLAWLKRCRRLSADREKATRSAEAMIRLAMTDMMLNRLCPTDNEPGFQYRQAG